VKSNASAVDFGIGTAVQRSHGGMFQDILAVADGVAQCNEYVVALFDENLPYRVNQTRRHHAGNCTGPIEADNKIDNPSNAW
jgi:hypothetical protein